MDYRVIKRYLPVFINLLSTILIPLIVLINILGDIDLDSGISEFYKTYGQITLIGILIGLLITIFTYLSIYFPKILKTKIISSLLSEALFLLYIIIISNLGRITLKEEHIEISFNISFLFLFLIGGPILSIIRSLYNFRIERNKFKPKFLILDVIDKRRNINSTIQLSKNLRSIEDLKYYPELKQDLMKNYGRYVSELQENRMIDQIGSYSLSKNGKKVLSKMRKILS